jgi:hypothetical protein
LSEVIIKNRKMQEKPKLDENDEIEEENEREKAARLKAE